MAQLEIKINPARLDELSGTLLLDGRVHQTSAASVRVLRGWAWQTIEAMGFKPVGDWALVAGRSTALKIEANPVPARKTSDEIREALKELLGDEWSDSVWSVDFNCVRGSTTATVYHGDRTETVQFG